MSMRTNMFLVAQLGARRHYAIPQMLNEAGMLSALYTDLCAVKNWPRLLSWLPRYLQPQGLRRLLGRIPHGVPKEKIHTMTRLGWDYYKSRSRGGTEQSIVNHLRFNKEFCEAIVKKGLGRATATYSFSSAGLELMSAARKAGLRVVMEQVIAPRALELEILTQAQIHYPGWLDWPLSPGYVDAFIEREEEEWTCADLILCGSEFVRQGIAERGGPIEKCKVVPYGVDSRFIIKRGIRPSGPLRVLTVGEVGLRKGSPVVWEAARLLGNQAMFRMVGGCAFPKAVLQSKPANVELTGVVPNSEILPYYQWADAFLLPSLCEGSATVTYEALMAGLPVVCTPNTGTLVEHNICGQIVPPFSPVAVAEALQKWIDDPDFLANCSKGALRKQSQLNLDAYKECFLNQLNTLSSPV
ncbi:Glycosyl transferases group 1 [Desulfofustis glycolicus DSM 9705]|uniref:Glycosyl transferases group 1 n=2 Tax=Desulfofustis glycolicus TaxID=51195 RepID=A0A1M5YPV7_9BACT|nr:Glycosyl transferases group 1 [Desulfofustis glycolicus DSM 9705]